MTCFRKDCNKCGKTLPIENFSKDKSRKDGFSYRCKSCQKSLHGKHYSKNKSKTLKKNREWYNLNKESRLRQCAEYYQNNKDKKHAYQRMRRKTNPQAKIAECLRGRVWSALNGVSKAQSIMDLLGCSIEELKTYLESQFQEGMTWENHGVDGWHIDHVKPCALFDLTKDSEQLVCFNYNNLQPLWAKENLSKGKKF